LTVRPLAERWKDRHTCKTVAALFSPPLGMSGSFFYRLHPGTRTRRRSHTDRAVVWKIAWIAVSGIPWALRVLRAYSVCAPDATTEQTWSLNARLWFMVTPSVTLICWYAITLPRDATNKYLVVRQMGKDQWVFFSLWSIYFIISKRKSSWF